jgi:uncharacterized membrane protein
VTTEEVHVPIRFGVSDWRGRRTAFVDRAGRGQLGCPPRMAAPGEQPVGLHGLCGHAYIVSILALAELINDKLPKTPSRKSPPGFIARIATGALCGAALGAPDQALIGSLLAGVIGAVAGTLGGYEFRSRLVRAIGGNDLPIALIEDAIAIVSAVLVVR